MSVFQETRSGCRNDSEGEKTCSFLDSIMSSPANILHRASLDIEQVCSLIYVRVHVRASTRMCHRNKMFKTNVDIYICQLFYCYGL